MLFGKVALIGVGLLGGSLGRALRQRACAGEVVGYARRPETLQECELTGATDHTSLDLNAVVRDADLIVLGTPLGEMGPMTRRLLPVLKAGAIVTDVGSVKAGVVSELEPLVHSAGAAFVGSHPMAGSEKTGVLASRDDLFQGAVCVITPTSQTPGPALRKIQALWEGVGGRVLQLTPEEHDVFVSRSSHLPHVLATELVHTVLGGNRPVNQRDLCATGFKSATRLASGSPEMWRDIALANRAALLEILGEFRDQLADFQQLLAAGDGSALLQRYVAAKQLRDDWLPVEAPASLMEPRTERPIS